MKKRTYVISLLLLFITGVIATIHSSYFEVKDILISGNRQISDEQILNIVGNIKGQNIFLIPGREVVNRLMNLDRLKGVKLERKFPDTLIIHVNEHIGLGLFKNVKGWLEITSGGSILYVYKNEPFPSLPLISGIEVEILDNKLIMTEELLRLLDILSSLLPMQSRMKEVSYDPDDVRILFDTRTVLYFGQDINIDKRLQVLKAIWDELSNQLEEIEYIDLRYDNKPVIRFFK